MDLIGELLRSLRSHAANNALHISGVNHTYADLDAAVARIRTHVLRDLPASEKLVGIVADDDLHTYAAIIALWAEGRAYVPLAVGTPVARNQDIIEQAGLRTVLFSEAGDTFAGVRMVAMHELATEATATPALPCADTEVAYLLFTSGTTGRPKGVPITRSAVSTFVDACEALVPGINASDRCLQMFELTFDLSVMSYLVPFLKGACIYTIPKDEIKYGYIFELMEEQALTVALMVPSIINYLRPYFEEIDCPAMRISMFCGEALPLDVTAEWSKCLPNARILNVYGPTEHTIFCTAYEFERHAPNKAQNGVLSIGRAMQGTQTFILDENDKPAAQGEKGELCLAGAQMTPGYWNNPEKNAEAFVTITTANGTTRCYRTGDICRMDEEGDLLYLGRKDHQAKIQGYRVELAEVEHHAKKQLARANAVALAVANSMGHHELVIVVEGAAPDKDALINGMKKSVPPYMVPSRILHMAALPLNTNGKIDRPAVLRWVSELPS